MFDVDRARTITDDVEVALRKIHCLDDVQRNELVERFNNIYGKCVPPKIFTYSIRSEKDKS